MFRSCWIIIKLTSLKTIQYLIFYSVTIYTYLNARNRIRGLVEILKFGGPIDGGYTYLCCSAMYLIIPACINDGVPSFLLNHFSPYKNHQFTTVYLCLSMCNTWTLQVYCFVWCLFCYTQRTLIIIMVILMMANRYYIGVVLLWIPMEYITKSVIYCNELISIIN